MNQNQKRILMAVVVVVVAMFIYPPFQAVRNGTVYNMGYGWIFTLSKRGYMTINVSMLIIQWIGVLVVGGLAFFLTKGESSPAELSTQKNKVDSHFKSDQHDMSDKRTSLSPKKVDLWWNWKSFLLAAVISVILHMIFLALAEATNTTKPSKNLGWTLLWMYTTIEAWKFWKWKALLPYLIYMITATIAGLIMVSAGVDNEPLTRLIVLGTLNLGGLIICGWLLNRARSSVAPETSVNEDAEIENIIRDAELRSAKKVSKITTTESEVNQQNEEFIALLKSTINENGLNTIPGDDLIEIYNRARSIAESSNDQDMTLSDAINILSEEIKKRGLPQESKPQEKESQDNSDYKESSLQSNQAVGWYKISASYVVTRGIVILLAIIIIWFAAIKPNYFNQESQDTEVVAKTQEASQELTAESWVNKAKTLWVDGKYTDPNKAIEYLNNAIKIEPGYASAYNNRGNAYNNIGNYNQAIKDYDKVIKLSPQNANAYNNRSDAYFAQGNNNLGCQDAQKACEMGVCKTLEWAKGKRYCDRKNKNKAALTETKNEQNDIGTKSHFDLVGFRDKFKDYYGDRPLDDVAKDAFKLGGFDKTSDYDTWKKVKGIEAIIEEDNERRKSSFSDK